MNSDQNKIAQLAGALGLALGALELVEASPDKYNHEGLSAVIVRARAALDMIYYYESTNQPDSEGE